MKDLIYKEALLKELKVSGGDCDSCPRFDGGCKGHLRWMCTKIAEAPLFDLVRCKDCRYWKEYKHPYEGDGMCGICGYLDRSADDYCSLAERK